MGRLSLFARAAFLILLIGSASAPVGAARDAFVMLSGGHAPLDNNYSQYLQAKAMVAFFQQNYPPDSIWVFFGAGNVEGKKPAFADVRRDIKRGGTNTSTWLPGALPRNRPARRDVILDALRDEILPAVADGGTLYLFVGDHGSEVKAESIIDLWSIERDARDAHGWRSRRSARLSVTDLREALLDGIGKGRIVFCMTQCHSGGFHFLGAPRTVMPNPKWFSRKPAWIAQTNETALFPAAAGFTATDEHSLASGCMPDPDPLRWAGYERFIPEQLIGVDLLSDTRTGKGLRSFSEAHIAATLVDHTSDKPYSTSEQYLERWASTIERMALEKDLLPEVRQRVTAYQRTVDGSEFNVRDEAFRERRETFRQFTEALAERSPSIRRLLLRGTRRDLENAIDRPPPRETPKDTEPESPPSLTKAPPSTRSAQPGRRPGTNAPNEALDLWHKILRPAWTAALETAAGKAIVGEAIALERHLLAQEAKSADFFTGTSRRRLLEEAYWHAGYSDLSSFVPARANAVMEWGVTRRPRILAWAKNSKKEEVRAAAEKLARRSGARRTANAKPPDRPSFPAENKSTAAERVLFYRRVLAAWEFLIAMDEKPALLRVRELSEIERIPLPEPQRRR